MIGQWISPPKSGTTLQVVSSRREASYRLGEQQTRVCQWGKLPACLSRKNRKLEAYATCTARPTRHRRCRSTGFTLLEMLLATALSIVLLSTLWSLFSIYTNLFDKGQQRVESSQLVRSLMQQISSDLRSAIQDPIAAAVDEEAGQSPERRFGMVGSANELRFDVLQLTPMRANTTPVGGRQVANEETPPSRVPELRTIHYQLAGNSQLTGSSASEDAIGAPQSGLVRREMDFESPTSGFEDPALADPMGGPEGMFAAADGQENPADMAESPAVAVDDSTLWVPEVAAVQFRFFDGNGWTTQWNSIQRKSLPVAVEVTLHISRGGRLPSSGESVAESLEALPDEPMTEEANVASGQTVHRLVVDLPGSPSYRKPRVAPTEPARPARPAVRRIAPPRWTPGERSTAGSDQWIRTGAR